MRPLYGLFPAFVGFICYPALAALADDSLPLKRVVLSTSGLALYEREGAITGDQTLELPVRLDRVDDVLKSLVILDSKGALGGVSLPGREPLSQAFRDLPFTEADLNDLSSLLNALRGSTVKIGAIEGRLLNVTPETEQTEKGVIVRRRVSVSTPTGIKTALIETADAIQFTDKAVQAQLDRALEAMFANRIKDQRAVKIALKGQGERNVGVAYIEEAPLWKSGYRLVLPKDGDKEPKALLQGWAVLENTTGQDWKDVRVTLTSGAPVTFKQALYESYYVDRPVLPVKFMDKIIPRADQGTVAKDTGVLQAQAYGGATGDALKEADAPFAPRQKALRAEAMNMAAPAIAGAPPMPQEAPTQMASVNAAAADETAAQMTFAFPEPVTLAAGDTLMIPFSAQDLPAEKIYVYQPDTNALHPLAAVSVKNDTASGLPPGILTLYDAGKNGLLHVGDAEMPMTPKGEKRFISYALDTKTSIDRQMSDDRVLGLFRISKGTVTQKVLSRNTTTYAIKAPPDEDRIVIIEQPRREGWELVKPEGLDGDVETTPTHYRLRVKVAAGKDKAVKATLQRTDDEYVAIIGASPADMDARIAAAGRDLPPALADALGKIRALQAGVFEIQQKLNDIEIQRQKIYADQDRLRQNLNTVSTNTPIGKRYLDTMNAQEDRLQQMALAQDDLNAKLQSATRALQDYIDGLDL